MTPYPKLYEYLRTVATVHLFEHDGDVWMTDQYLLTRASSPLRDVFGHWNLALLPGSYDVTDTIKRAKSDRATPDLGQILAVPTDASPVKRHTLHGVDTFIDAGGMAAVFECAHGEFIAVSAEKLRMVELLTLPNGVEWLGVSGTKPLLWVDANRVTVAALMPIRVSAFTDAHLAVSA